MIGRARPGDAAGILALHAPIVERTAISFETATPTFDEMSRRIASALDTHDWRVAEISRRKP